MFSGVAVVKREGPHGGKKKVRGSGNFSLSATGQLGLHQGTLQWVWRMLDEANGFDFASSHTRRFDQGLLLVSFSFDMDADDGSARCWRGEEEVSRKKKSQKRI